MADFGQSNLGQSIFVLCCVVVGIGVGVSFSVGVCCGYCWLLLVWTSPGPPEAGPPNILRFFPLPHPFSLFLGLSGCLLVEFWWFFEDQDPQMYTFGLSGCRPGLTRQPKKELVDPNEGGCVSA